MFASKLLIHAWKHQSGSDPQGGSLCKYLSSIFLQSAVPFFANVISLSTPIHPQLMNTSNYRKETFFISNTIQWHFVDNGCRILWCMVTLEMLFWCCNLNKSCQTCYSSVFLVFIMFSFNNKNKKSYILLTILCKFEKFTSVSDWISSKKW